MRYLCIIFCGILLTFSSLLAQAEVPKLINYQGKLTTPQGAPLDTTVSMQFSIYSDSTGGDPLWTESQASVKVDKGIFNVLLGSVNEIPESMFTGNIRYLGVKIAEDPEMTPRKAIVSVGYAYNSTMLDGKHAGNDTGNIPVNNGNLNVNLNANYLDGFDAQTLISPIKQVIRDTMYVGPPDCVRTKEFSPSINPNKSVVILGQPNFYNGYGHEPHLWGLTSNNVTIWVNSCGGPGSYYVDYQIIEYK